MERIIQTFNNFCEVKVKLRNACLDKIKELLKERENKSITFDRDVMEENGLYSITLTYDGGNHPEYASNAFSELEGIHLDEYDFVVFEIEDCDEYDESRVWSIDEIYDATIFLVDYCDAEKNE